MKNKILLLLLIVTIGCKRENPEPESPAKATLVFPASNALCTAGTVISATQSTVILTWNASANSDSYAVTIKNLITGDVVTQGTNTNQLAVTILRGTPYSWYVVSKSASTSATAQSDTWKFYNSGVGIINYPPFPAAIIEPIFSQIITTSNSMITLTWSGSDTDGDIAGYDIYFGTTSTPPLFRTNYTNMSLGNVPVVAKTTYYWKVITKDTQGNTSDSGTYQFTLN
jgi:hypothetical protein